ncbi:MAG: CDP-alcohol phosphatidyltransferase family protein [Pseudomonadota bacterium]|nr:CDP-alcohol phosphatidyltransferase family protein [Pseudomonadota bacterium]
MSGAAVIQFSSRASAVGLVAGLPAAARAVREVALAGLGECWLQLGSGEGLEPPVLDLSVREEIARLAGTMVVHGATGTTPPPHGRVLSITGEALVDAAAIRAALATGASLNPGLRFTKVGGGVEAGAQASRHLPRVGSEIWAPRYAAMGRVIIKATAKSTDGLVSHHLNRPISQAISFGLLKLPHIRPIHATWGTAVLAMLMFAVLVLDGSPAGLIGGAVLFQAASVFDGVDGEIARATYRTSDRGAMIDSLIDAATNLSLLAGIVINLAQRGRWGPAMFGIAGLAMLAMGLATLGGRARRSGAPITFDGLKGRFRDNGSGWGKWVVWLTMRDFLALALVVLVVAGLTEEAIMAFSAIMAVWLVVVLTTHVRQSVLRG